MTIQTSAPRTQAPGTARAMNRRAFVRFAALGCATVALGLARPARATEGASQQTQAALSDAQAAYEQAMSQLSSLTQKAELAQYSLNETEAALADTNDQIASLQDTITQKQGELADAQDVLADRVDAAYKAGKTDVLSVILDATSFEDLANRIFYAGKTSDADAQAIQTVKDLKAELQASQDELVVQQAAQQQLQAQQEQDIANLQEQLAAAQEKLKDVKVSASAGGGMVKVEANGEMQLTSVQISPEACDPEDAELLQDMVLAAVNEALSSAQEAAGAQMSAATGLGGMNIPGLF